MSLDRVREALLSWSASLTEHEPGYWLVDHDEADRTKVLIPEALSELATHQKEDEEREREVLRLKNVALVAGTQLQELQTTTRTLAEQRDSAYVDLDELLEAAKGPNADEGEPPVYVSLAWLKRLHQVIKNIEGDK